MSTTLQHALPKQAHHSPNHEYHSQGTQAYPSRTIVHAKLEMTEPGDHDEQEADDVANTIASGGKISRKISGGGGSSGIAVSQQMESQLSQLQGGGRQMPEGLRNMMESGFGQVFSQVRLHTDGEAANMSSSIHAKAFTLGNDIYFNSGQFAPETSEGQRLVAHELTHVTQGTGKIGREGEDEEKRSKTTNPNWIPQNVLNRIKTWRTSSRDSELTNMEQGPPAPKGTVFLHDDNFSKDKGMLAAEMNKLYYSCFNDVKDDLFIRAQSLGKNDVEIFDQLWASIINDIDNGRGLQPNDPDYPLKIKMRPYVEECLSKKRSLNVFNFTRDFIKKNPISDIFDNASSPANAHFIFAHGNRFGLTYDGNDYRSIEGEGKTAKDFRDEITKRYDIKPKDYVFLVSCYTGNDDKKGFAKSLSEIMQDNVIIAPSTPIRYDLSVKAYDLINDGIFAFYRGKRHLIAYSIGDAQERSDIVPITELFIDEVTNPN